MGHGMLPEWAAGPRALEVVSLCGCRRCWRCDKDPILGWDELHGCPASFAGLFAPYEKMTWHGTRQEQQGNPAQR